jgi:hypothetical protein
LGNHSNLRCLLISARSVLGDKIWWEGEGCVPRPVRRDAIVQVHVDAHLQDGVRAGVLTVDTDPRRHGVQDVAVGARREFYVGHFDGARDGSVAGARQDGAGPVLVVVHGGRRLFGGLGEERLQAVA